jgi:hypothetical protein
LDLEEPAAEAEGEAAEEVDMETSDNSDTDEALERPSPDEAAAAEDSQT